MGQRRQIIKPLCNSRKTLVNYLDLLANKISYSRARSERELRFLDTLPERPHRVMAVWLSLVDEAVNGGQTLHLDCSIDSWSRSVQQAQEMKTRLWWIVMKCPPYLSLFTRARADLALVPLLHWSNDLKPITNLFQICRLQLVEVSRSFFCLQSGVTYWPPELANTASFDQKRQFTMRDAVSATLST